MNNLHWPCTPLITPFTGTLLTWHLVTFLLSYSQCLLQMNPLLLIWTRIVLSPTLHFMFVQHNSKSDLPLSHFNSSLMDFSLILTVITITSKFFPSFHLPDTSNSSPSSNPIVKKNIHNSSGYVWKPVLAKIAWGKINEKYGYTIIKGGVFFRQLFKQDKEEL